MPTNHTRWCCNQLDEGRLSSEARTIGVADQNLAVRTRLLYELDEAARSGLAERGGDGDHRGHILLKRRQIRQQRSEMAAADTCRSKSIARSGAAP